MNDGSNKYQMNEIHNRQEGDLTFDVFPSAKP